MNYFISHTGKVRDESSDFDERTFFERSAMTNVKTKCGCDYVRLSAFTLTQIEEAKNKSQTLLK